MATKIIHVNRQFIATNNKLGKPVLPTYIVREGNKVTYGFGVSINGPSRMVDVRTHKPLKCGAKAWMETEADLEIIGAMTFREAKQLLEKVSK